MVGGSKGTEAASQGAEWQLGRSEVPKSGGGAAGLGESQGKAMTGGSTCQSGTERDEGRKPELGPIEEIKHFRILFGIRIFGKF
jgi:hypothetical protein